MMLSQAEILRFHGSDNYMTDEWILSMFPGYFDPCPFNPNWKEGVDLDGLKIAWQKYNFVNPPYSNPKPWVIKAIQENEKGNVVVMLLKHDSSTEWYRRLHEAGARFLMINRRLQYQTGRSANFPSMLAVLS